MLLYVGLFIGISILSLVEVLYKNKKILFFIFFVLALFAGLRFQTGLDFLTYYNFFEKTNSITDIFNGSIDAEPGFVFLNYLFKITGLNYHTFILFFSFIVLGLLTIYLYSNFESPSMFLVYYFARFYFARDMGQIRGAIASIILLYSVKYISQRKIIPFIIVVSIASLFHVSSLIFIVGYIFVNYIPKDNMRNLFIVLILALIMGILIKAQFLYIWLIPERYLAYFINPYYVGGAWLKNPVLWMQLLIYFGTLLFTNIRENKQFKIYLDLYFIASLCLIAFGNMSTVGGRLSSPFATYEIFVVPYLFINLTKNKLFNIIMLFGFTLVIFCLIFIISGNYQFYVPYFNIFYFMITA